MPENGPSPVNPNMNELRREPIPESPPTPEQGQTDEPSKSVEEATSNEREVRKKQKNVEDLVKWLTENEVDPDFVNKFKEAILQNESSDQNSAESKNLDQTIEFIQALPKHLENFLSSIKNLEAKPGFSEKKLHEKKSEIIQGMCQSVSNGHLTAEDALSSVRGIEIIPKTGNPKELQERIDKMISTSGYDAVLYNDHGKVVIFEESLIDDFKTSDGKSMELDFKHLLNHELSHSLVEKALHRNEQLTERANEIIAQASELKDLQSQHVRNTLDGLANVKADFNKDFAENEAKSAAYLALDDEGKAKAKEIAEKTFVDKRNRIAANEIMTDYTSIFLQSDGTIENFCQVCLQKVDHKKFAECLGVSRMRIKELNNLKTQEEKSIWLEKYKKNSSKFEKILEIYTSLFHEIKKSVGENKGKFVDIIDEDEEEGLSVGGLGMPETANNFERNDRGNRDTEGVSSEFFALVAAMADEVAPNEIAGGQIPK